MRPNSRLNLTREQLSEQLLKSRQKRNHQYCFGQTWVKSSSLSALGDRRKPTQQIFTETFSYMLGEQEQSKGSPKMGMANYGN